MTISVIYFYVKHDSNVLPCFAQTFVNIECCRLVVTFKLLLPEIIFEIVSGQKEVAAARCLLCFITPDQNVSIKCNLCRNNLFGVIGFQK